ncbi:MAG: hypothetical protein GX443_03345 [Deltaproteobacteria bacterium]|nr:hypothetical protein [Deltaproteobacteria bacterium]
METVRITGRPSCRSRKINKVRRNWSGIHQGQPNTVPSQEVYERPACGEKVYDHGAKRKIEAHSPALATALA